MAVMRVFDAREVVSKTRMRKRNGGAHLIPPTPNPSSVILPAVTSLVIVVVVVIVARHVFEVVVEKYRKSERPASKYGHVTSLTFNATSECN